MSICDPKMCRSMTSIVGFLKDHILWDPRRQMLHPTIGIDSFHPLEVNWGTKPFMYNFEEVREF